MSVVVAVTRVVCDTTAAPNLQDITTVDLGGLTPKAAIFIVSSAVTDAAAAAHASLSLGAATGASNEWATCGFDEDNLDATDVYDGYSNTSCIYILAADGTVDGDAEFNSWLTNGVRINWTNAPAAAYLLTVVLFAGSDLSAVAGTVDLGSVIDNVIDINTIGFEPDDVICSLTGVTPGIGQNWRECTQPGFVHNAGGGAVTQRGFGKYWRDALATSSNSARLINTGVTVKVDASGNTVFYVEASDFDANGFSVTTRVAGANGDDFCYLALNYNGVVSSWVGLHTTPVATGNNSETGPGFTPQFVMMIPTLCEVINTAYVDGRSGAFGFSAFDADDEYSTVVASQDAAATSNTQSLSDARAIVLTDHAGALDIEATFVSFNANGWTVNYSNVPATAKLFPALVIGAEAGEATITGTALGQALFKETKKLATIGAALFKETPSMRAIGQALVKGLVSVAAIGQAIIKGTVGRTAIGQALFKETAAAAAIGQAWLSQIFSAAAVGLALLKETASNSAIGQALLKETAKAAALGQALFRETKSVAALGQAYLKEQISNSALAQALLKETRKVAAIGQALFKETKKATALGQALFKETKKVAVVGAALLKETKKALALGQAWLSQTVSNTAPGQALLKETKKVAALAQAELVDIGVTTRRYAAIGLALFKETFSTTALGLALLRETVSDSALGQAIIKETRRVAAIGQALFKETIGRTALGQALLKETRKVAAVIQAWLVDHTAIAAIFYALFKETVSGTALAQAWIKSAVAPATDMQVQPRAFSMSVQQRSFSMETPERGFSMTVEKRQ